MLTHIVLYKLKPGVTDKQLQPLLEQARMRLPGIPGVKNLRAGICIYKEDAYQCALVMDFDDVEGLEKYRVHPIHVKFLEEVVNPLVDEVRRHDYVEN